MGIKTDCTQPSISYLAFVSFIQSHHCRERTYLHIGNSVGWENSGVCP